MKLIFRMQINIKLSKGFQGDFKTPGIEVSNKMILSLLMGMIKHFQSITSLQNLCNISKK